MIMAKRVFFSFHYQDVIDFRTNVVRQSWVSQPDRESAGFFDASLWETSKRKGDDSLKKLIHEGLNGTTVTAVLIGSETYSRRWVRYEILKSLMDGNQILGIHINSIPCKNRQIKNQGPNPFEYLAVKFSASGDSVSPCEWNGNKWVYYSDLPAWTLNKAQPENADQLKKVTAYSSCYDWKQDDGYNNFGSWLK